MTSEYIARAMLCGVLKVGTWGCWVSPHSHTAYKHTRIPTMTSYPPSPHTHQAVDDTATSVTLLSSQTYFYLFLSHNSYKSTHFFFIILVTIFMTKWLTITGEKNILSSKIPTAGLQYFILSLSTTLPTYAFFFFFDVLSIPQDYQFCFCWKTAREQSQI